MLLPELGLAQPLEPAKRGQDCLTEASSVLVSTPEAVLDQRHERRQTFKLPGLGFLTVMVLLSLPFHELN